MSERRGRQRREIPVALCEICGEPITKPRANRDYQVRTCSRKCSAILGVREGTKPVPKNHPGQENTNWKGGVKWAGGYRMILVPPETPGVTRRGYMMEHRYVMQEKLGRPLEMTEQVHHRNGIKADNRAENLEVVTHTKHFGEVTCPHCRRAFLIR